VTFISGRTDRGFSPTRLWRPHALDAPCGHADQQRAARPGVRLGRVDGPRLFDRAAPPFRPHGIRRRDRPAFPGGRRAARGHRRRRRGQARRGRRDVRLPGQARRPAFGTRLGVLAVPADVDAGLAAVGHHQTGRERDTAQRALGGRQRPVPVVTLRSHRWIPPRELAAHRTTASSSDPPDKGTVKAGEADAAIVPPTDTGHGNLRRPEVPRSTTERVDVQAQNQVSHSGMDDSGKAAKFFTCPPKATQASY